MTVSVVICAYTLDRWDALVEAVSSCLGQSRPPDEVVVVIDHNDALLARASSDLGAATVVANGSSRGLSGARNSGVEASHGDVVVFLDDDAYADASWLEHLVAPLDDDAIAGVGGWIVPHFEQAAPRWFPHTFYWIIGCSYDGLPDTGSTLRNPIGASMAIRRRVFTTVGGFTSGIGRIGKVPLGCEETELCIRYTAARPTERFVLTRDSVVHHRVPASRLTWHYFWSRCWAEGLSKAAVASLVGASSGLAAERAHLARALPRELARAVGAIPKERTAAATRASLIVVGTAIAAMGLVRGQLSVRRHPIEPGAHGIAPTANRGDDGATPWTRVNQGEG